MKLVHAYNGKNWKAVASQLPGRTDVQCLHRWQKVLNPELTKGPWSAEEDARLVHFVNQFGPRSWSKISSHMPGRIGKQCRERWFNHLDPEINKEPWTADEDNMIIAAHAEIGPRWAEIAKRLPGRSDNSVKNRFNSTIRRQMRRAAEASPASSPGSSLTIKLSSPSNGKTKISLGRPRRVKRTKLVVKRSAGDDTESDREIVYGADEEFVAPQQEEAARTVLAPLVDAATSPSGATHVSPNNKESVSKKRSRNEEAASDELYCQTSELSANDETDTDKENSGCAPAAKRQCCDTDVPTMVPVQQNEAYATASVNPLLLSLLNQQLQGYTNMLSQAAAAGLSMQSSGAAPISAQPSLMLALQLLQQGSWGQMAPKPQQPQDQRAKTEMDTTAELI